MNRTTSSLFYKLKCTAISICLAVTSIQPTTLFAQGKDVDFIVPEISQVQEIEGVQEQQQTIVVTVTDNSAVQYVKLFYRLNSTGEFIAEPMKPSSGNRFEATVSTRDSKKSSLQYFLKAADISGNSTFRGNAISPKTIKLTPQSVEQTTTTETTPVPAPSSTTTQPVEPTPAPVAKSGKSRLYTVLGVLAAVVLVGAVAGASGGGSGGGGSTCPVEGCSVTFIGTPP